MTSDDVTILAIILLGKREGKNQTLCEGKYRTLCISRVGWAQSKAYPTKKVLSVSDDEKTEISLYFD